MSKIFVCESIFSSSISSFEDDQAEEGGKMSFNLKPINHPLSYYGSGRPS